MDKLSRSTHGCSVETEEVRPPGGPVPTPGVRPAGDTEPPRPGRHSAPPRAVW